MQMSENAIRKSMAYIVQVACEIQLEKSVYNFFAAY